MLATTHPHQVLRPRLHLAVLPLFAVTWVGCGHAEAPQPVAEVAATDFSLSAHGVGGYGVTDDSPGVADGNAPLTVQLAFVDTSSDGEPVVGLVVRAACSEPNVHVGVVAPTGADGTTSYTVTSTTSGMVSLSHALGADPNAFNVHIVSFAGAAALDAPEAFADPRPPE